MLTRLIVDETKGLSNSFGSSLKHGKQAKIDMNKPLKDKIEDVRFFFSPRQVNSCIISSEVIRSFFAIMIALFVLLSYIDYPLFGRNIVRSESVLASKPLYILLLMDVTLVFGRLCLEKRGGSNAERVVGREGADNWAVAERLLERGLVVYQAIRAIFIDCSVYAVIIICGLSFL